MSRSMGIVLALALLAGQLAARSRGSSDIGDKVRIAGFSDRFHVRHAAAHSSLLPQASSLVAVINTECLLMGLGGEISRQAASDGPHVLSLQAYSWPTRQAYSLAELSALANSDPCVRMITENRHLSTMGDFMDDPKSGTQAHLHVLHADAAYEFFWNSSLKIDREIIIAIIDTGVDYSHEDLSEQMWHDAKGKVGYDFFNNDDDPADDNGHGTHVAGLAAAKSSNQIGVSGVMGFKVKIMAVKAMDSSGGGDIPEFINGIRYAVAHGADILNLSLGGPGENAAVEDALREAVGKGVFIVAAAGNQGQELTNTNFYSPASYGAGLAGMITVGAFGTDTMSPADFSNYSTTFVEIGAPGTAPGGGLLSTWPADKYDVMEGTSMAAPIVAGSAALALGMLRTQGLSPTPAELENDMQEATLRAASLSRAFRRGQRLDLFELGRYLQDSVLTEGSTGLDEE